MKVAALDLGSNTFLCLICEIENGKVVKVYSDQVEMVRLGQELSRTQQFHIEALYRADAALKKFSQKIEEHQPVKILAMATAAARDAKNSDELFKICDKYKIPLQIITGDKETQMTYLGAVSGQQEQIKQLVIDIGGRSTEFILGEGKKYIEGISLNIGCVKLTEKYITSYPVKMSDFNLCRQEVINELEKVNFLAGQSISQILAVAGTPTALVAAELGRFDEKIIEGFCLTETKLQEWLSFLTNASIDQIEKKGIEKGRADVILVGVIILLETLKKFKQTRIIVSTRGVRYGVAIEVANQK